VSAIHPSALQPPSNHTVALQVALYVRTRTLDEVLLMVKEHQGPHITLVSCI
jgi:hypothetical protein